jgi:hypothetical protein
MRKRSKPKKYTSDDINILDDAIVKVKTLDADKPNVIEVTITFYAIPEVDKTQDEYITSIKKIRKAYNFACYQFVEDNCDLYWRDYITDFNFTSANLKKGYKKKVTMSLFLRQFGYLKINDIESDIKETIIPLTKLVIDKCNSSDFKCRKTKLKKVVVSDENH